MTVAATQLDTGMPARTVACARILALLLCCSAGVAGQGTLPGDSVPQKTKTAGQSSSQPQSDLSAAARKARAERERQGAQRTENSDAVNEMAAELSEENQAEMRGAPVGYRYYSFKAGDYNILVPASAELQARGSYGLELLSSEVMGPRTLVMLGDPIPAQGSTAEEILSNAASQYLGCARRFRSLGPSVDGHPASGLSGISMCQRLDREVMGYAEFILNDTYVVPVVCGYPYLAEDLDPNPNRPITAIVKKYDRQRNGFRACDTIMPSVHFNPHGSNWRPKVSVTAAKSSVPAVLKASRPVLENAQAEEPSLGAVARASKKPPMKEVLTNLRHAVPGFYSYSFDYCSKEECYTGYLQVPVKARKNEQFNVAYTGLFEFEVPVGDTIAIIQATKGAPTKAGVISREEFINTKVDWWISNVPAVHFTGAGQGEVLSEELTTISGMPARLSTFRSPTAFQPVMTQLAAYMAPGVFVQLRCSVPEKVYADAQDMCERVVRSLTVPLREDKTEEDPAPESNDDR